MGRLLIETVYVSKSDRLEETRRRYHGAIHGQGEAVTRLQLPSTLISFVTKEGLASTLDV